MEGDTLIAVEEANVSRDGGETCDNNPFQDLGDGLKENNDAE